MRRTGTGRWSVIFAVVLCLIMGTVFVFGQRYWEASVERQDCEIVYTQFASYAVEGNYRGNHIRTILVDCEDGQRYFINGPLARGGVAEELKKLRPGEEITLLLHPHSDRSVVELSGENGTLLSFDTSMKKLAADRKGFLILGLVLYGIALGDLGWLIRWDLRARKRRAARRT